MNENNEKNLSVEEILREAEEVLRSIDRKSEETKGKIKNVNEPLELEEDDVKAYVPSSPKSGGVNEKTTRVVLPVDGDEEMKIVPEKPSKQEKTQNSAPARVTDKTIVSPADGKTRAVRTTDKTAVISGSFSKKKRFFPREDAYSETPPEIIEKAATIKSKSRFDKTLDLQEIPTILAVEELDKTRVMLSSEHDDIENNAFEEEYDSSDQIKMSGFDDEVSEIPTIDEETAEEQLRLRREEKVNKFRLFTQEELNSDKASEAKKIKFDDYKDRSERTQTLERLFKKKNSVQLQLSFTVVLGAVLFILTILQDTPSMPAVFNGTFEFYITATVLFALIVLLNIKTVIHGLDFRKGINSDFPVTVSVLAALCSSIALAVNPDLYFSGGSFLAPASVFALFMSAAGKRLVLVRIIKNFEFLTKNGDKSTVEDIVNEVDASIISKNMLDSEPYLKYSVKTDFPTSFLEISFANEPADRISKVLSPVLIGFNAALFVAIGLIFQNWETASYFLAAGLIISCPVVTLTATNTALCAVSNALEKKGAMVCGFEGAHYIHNSNALVMEASDLFSARSCYLHGFKTFNGTKIDDAILQTAAVIIKTNSPLASVFDDVIVGKKSILPEVDGVVYEDKMGTSAWIYQRKILVGNRELLKKHGVSVPKIEYENKYTKKGRKALYLAVAGKISAMFIVSYSADSALKKTLKKLEKSGITVILRSCDPYINEESLTQLFDVPEGFIRVMTASNGRSFEKYSEAVAEKSPAYAVHDGSALAFFSTVLGADNLVSTEKIISALSSFGSAIGFGVAALLAFVDGLSQLNAVNIVIFQLIWSAFVLLVTKLRKTGIK
uniref:hypothetical protein n=1 Tax=Eubacterium sp. TaxID=142586 RepID=UPI004027A562